MHKELGNRPEIIKQEVLPQYYDAIHWLHTFITDPEGERYSIEKTSEERLEEYEAQIKRMGEFLEFLGNPQDQFSSVHIAGTGGRGSTSMMIGKILEGVSSQVGVHTSPYLQVPGEKFLINGKMIPPSRFVQLTNSLKEKHEEFKEQNPEIMLHYGEMWVALYNLHFAESNLDWGVIETGMGGRFDPTNILMPELSVITNVDFDHVPQLGTTLEEIAWHKAGIIKQGKPIITSEQKPDTLSVIQREAIQKGSKLYCLDRDFSWKLVSINDRETVINVFGPYKQYENIRIPLTGFFQAQNAGLAVAAVDVLAHDHGFSLDSEIINETLIDLVFPGRMEAIQESPTVILDGAHNPQKMSALANAMAEIYPEKKFTLICGMLGTKDASCSIASLLPQAERVITAKPQVVGKPGIEAINLAEMIRADSYSNQLDVCSSVKQAIELALNEAKPDDIILVAGSLYMLGEARGYWVNPEDLLLKAELEIK